MAGKLRSVQQPPLVIRGQRVLLVARLDAGQRGFPPNLDQGIDTFFNVLKGLDYFRDALAGNVLEAASLEDGADVLGDLIQAGRRLRVGHAVADGENQLVDGLNVFHDAVGRAFRRLNNGIKFVRHGRESILRVARLADGRDLAPDLLDAIKQPQDFLPEDMRIIKVVH